MGGGERDDGRRIDFRKNKKKQFVKRKTCTRHAHTAGTAGTAGIMPALQTRRAYTHKNSGYWCPQRQRVQVDDRPTNKAGRDDRPTKHAMIMKKL